MAVDGFGITQLYPTIAGGMLWEANWAASRSWGFAVDPNDPWFDTAHGTATYAAASNVLTISGDTPRMYVRNPDNNTQWRDVEITCYFMRVQAAVGRAEPAYAGMEVVA